MGKEKILIVEDEAIVAMLLKKTLTGWGYDVCGTVASGQEAIEKALSLHPDLILMDILLDDGTSGVEAAQAIQKEMPMRIIYTTGTANEGLLERAATTNPVAVLRKPYGLEDLEESLSRALRTPSSAGDMEEAP